MLYASRHTNSGILSVSHRAIVIIPHNTFHECKLKQSELESLFRYLYISKIFEVFLMMFLRNLMHS